MSLSISCCHLSETEGPLPCRFAGAGAGTATPDRARTSAFWNLVSMLLPDGVSVVLCLAPRVRRGAYDFHERGAIGQNADFRVVWR